MPGPGDRDSEAVRGSGLCDSRSHFNPSFGNVKAFNLKKLKLSESLSPSPQWPQAAALRLARGGDGRQVAQASDSESSQNFIVGDVTTKT